MVLVSVAGCCGCSSLISSFKWFWSCQFHPILCIVLCLSHFVVVVVVPFMRKAIYAAAAAATAAIGLFQASPSHHVWIIFLLWIVPQSLWCFLLCCHMAMIMINWTSFFWWQKWWPQSMARSRRNYGDPYFYYTTCQDPGGKSIKSRQRAGSTEFLVQNAIE